MRSLHRIWSNDRRGGYLSPIRKKHFILPWGMGIEASTREINNLIDELQILSRLEKSRRDSLKHAFVMEMITVCKMFYRKVQKRGHQVEYCPATGERQYAPERP